MRRKIALLLVMLLILPVLVFSRVPDTDKDYYVIKYNEGDIARSQEVIQDELFVEGYIPYHKYIVYASVREVEKLVEKGFIDSYEEYTAIDTFVEEDFLDYEMFNVLLFKSADENKVAEEIRNLGGSVLEVHESLMLVENDLFLLEDVVLLKGVEAVEPKYEVELFNNKANILSGVAGIGGVRNTLGLFGEGQIIAICDSGLDVGKVGAVGSNMHEDFNGRILGIYDVADLYSGSLISTKGVDYEGHGTNVVGVALGNGVKSGSDPTKHKYDGSYAGAAPEAKLVFQSSGSYSPISGKYYSTPKTQIDTYLFLPVYNFGVRVHSNSWGVPDSYGVYSSASKRLDDFTNKNKDMNILFAAGNDGTQQGTVVIPSTAKNSISVGGIVTTIPNKQIYGRGPTADGRFKPDILAPASTAVGQGLTTTKSSMQKPYPIGCRGGPGGALEPFYCELSGTSASTPHVAGLVALIREFYDKKVNVANPSAALIKATLLNGADDINNGVPNLEYGWGRANISRSLPEDYKKSLRFFDVKQGLKTYEDYEFDLAIVEGKPFRLTLVWTDYPAAVKANPTLVNNLDLIVTGPDGTFYGNDITVPYNNQKDRLNNVEKVEIKNPKGGVYKVQVKGYNVPVGSQDFAIVASAQSFVDLKLEGQVKPGNKINFKISDPEHPNAQYVFMLSLGKAPGITLQDKRVIPLNPDAIFMLSLDPVVGPLVGFNNFIGKLDSKGEATASWVIPKWLYFPGLKLYGGAVVLDTSKYYPPDPRAFEAISAPVEMVF